VGDIVKVWVLEVDKQRRRVSLTMIAPGTQRTIGRRPAKPEEKPAQEAPRRPPERRPPERRPPRRGPPERGRARPPAPSGPPKPPPKPKPKKPLTPLTDEMKKGKAPLRTFGDLMQFYELKHAPPPPPPPPEEPKPAEDEKKDEG